MNRSLPSEDRRTRFTSLPAGSMALVDLVTRAKVIHVRTDLVTRVTIYGAALLATAGFMVATAVDEVLRPRSRVRP